MNADSVEPQPHLPRALSVANKMMIRMLRRGAGPRFLRLLTVAGRVSGEPRSTPVVPVIGAGGPWLVAAYGEVAWVRNVRAAGRVELQRGADRVAYDARELTAHEAVPVLRAYLSMPTAIAVRKRFAVNKRSSDDAIAADAVRHPAFALTPVAPSSGDR